MTRTRTALLAFVLALAACGGAPEPGAWLLGCHEGSFPGIRWGRLELSSPAPAESRAQSYGSVRFWDTSDLDNPQLLYEGVAAAYGVDASSGMVRVAIPGLIPFLMYVAPTTGGIVGAAWGSGLNAAAFWWRPCGSGVGRSPPPPERGGNHGS